MWDKIVAYDVETTGYVPNRHKIIEIGAVSITSLSSEVEEFGSLINVNEKLKPHITKVTGITNGMLKGGGILKFVIEDFIDFCYSDAERVLFVGHNANRFDNPFINIALKPLRVKITEKITWDTMLQMRAELLGIRGINHIRAQHLASKRKPPQKTNLGATCEHYGIQQALPAHRATNDALNTLEIFKTQLKRSKWKVLKA